jgi:predicted dehydrogenase
MIRVAIVGAGAVIEGLYAQALRILEKSGALRVEAVIDPVESRARLVARQFKRATAYPSHESAFSAGSYELALIASPPHLHVVHTLAAIANGCHVLCEKPMATSTADGESMLAASQKADRLLGIALPRRFFPNFADVAALVAAGSLGNDLQFTHREGGTYSWPISSGAGFERSTSGGGVLIDRGVHMLDQLQWIFGNPPSVKRSFDDSLVGGVETNSMVEVVFPQARGVLQASWEYPLNNGLHIRGSLGEVFLHGDSIREYRRKSAGGTWTIVPASANWPVDVARCGKRDFPRNIEDCVKLQLIAMVRAISYGEALPVSGHTAMAVQRAIGDAYQRAEPLPSAWLTASEQAEQRARHWSRGGCDV